MRTAEFIWFIFLLAISQSISYGQGAKTVAYLIPGQGADARQFEHLKLGPQFEIKNIEYFTPDKGWGMKEYAEALSRQIDTTNQFIIIGVSLGGMLATEMGDFLHPEKIILISSAKCRKELPGRYRFQKAIPLYKCFTGGMIKCGAKFMQPIVEPDSRSDRPFFLEMLNEKDPAFMKRTVAMIIGWEREEYRRDIAHIHGDKDHTIPLKNVAADHLISEGSHMMVFTRAGEISEAINKILSNGIH